VKTRTTIAITAILAVFSAALNTTSAQPASPADISEVTLNNGLHVIVKQAHSWPLVAVGVVVRAGSLYEGDFAPGTARYVAHLLVDSERGANRSLRDVMADKLGAIVQASTFKDSVTVTLTAHKQVIPEALPLLAEGLFGASFDDTQMARARLELRQILRDSEADAVAMISHMLWKMAYGEHPYTNPASGTLESIEQVSSDDVTRFYKRFYVPNNAAIIAVGDVDPQEFFQQVRATFGDYVARDIHWQAPRVSPTQTKPRIQSERYQASLALVGIAWRAPGVADWRDVCALDLIYTLLRPGPGSLLGAKLQPGGEAGSIAINWDVEFVTHKQPGLFQVLVVPTPGHELQARQAVLEVISSLREQPVSAGQLAAAKQELYAEYCFDNESYDEQVATMAFYEAIDSYKRALTYIDQINAVTPQRLQLAAQKYLAPGAYNLAILRPQANHAAEARLP